MLHYQQPNYGILSCVLFTSYVKENIPKELVDAFRGMDPGRKGVIKAKDLWHILVKWGERLSPREGK